MSGTVAHSTLPTTTLDSTQFYATTTHKVGGTASLYVMETNDVHAVPIAGATSACISSEWAYNHTHIEEDADPHPVYTRESLFGKGKILVGSEAGVVQAQSTGPDGYALTAASTETTGLSWTVPASGGFTEARGATTLNSTATSRNVYHYLGDIPNVIQVTFKEQGTADYGRWWVAPTLTDSTRFVLYVTSPPGISNLDFYWYVRKI